VKRIIDLSFCSNSILKALILSLILATAAILPLSAVDIDSPLSESSEGAFSGSEPNALQSPQIYEPDAEKAPESKPPEILES